MSRTRAVKSANSKKLEPKVKNLPETLAYVKRQEALGRSRVCINGKYMALPLALNWLYEQHPWLQKDCEKFRVLVLRSQTRERL